MELQVISLDAGRNALKALSGRRRVSIPAIVGEWRQRKISEGGDYEVAINGEKCFVGYLAEFESRFRREMVSRSKIHAESRILALTAIALLADPGRRLKVITGLPVEEHQAETKRRFIALLAGNHAVTVNGQRVNFSIGEDDVAVSVEGGGAYWAAAAADPEMGRGKCRIVDIGSRTVNLLTIVHNRFRDVDSYSLDYGCLELLNACKSDEETARQFARRIIGDLSRRWLDLAPTDKVLLTGGGALLLGEYLIEGLPTAKIVDDPIFANAAGFYAMGLKKWQKAL